MSDRTPVPDQPTDPTRAEHVVLPVAPVPVHLPQEARDNPAPVVHGPFAEVTPVMAPNGPQGPTKVSPFAEVEHIELEVKDDAEEVLVEGEKLAGEAEEDAKKLLDDLEDKGPPAEDPAVQYVTPAEDPLNGSE